MSLTDRIRTIASDVQQGDTSGSLRDEVEQLKAATDEEFGRVATDIHSLQEQVANITQQMKQLGN
jgi:gas vesicle protein